MNDDDVNDDDAVKVTVTVLVTTTTVTVTAVSTVTVDGDGDALPKIGSECYFLTCQTVLHCSGPKQRKLTRSL